MNRVIAPLFRMCTFTQRDVHQLEFSYTLLQDLPSRMCCVQDIQFERFSLSYALKESSHALYKNATYIT